MFVDETVTRSIVCKKYLINALKIVSRIYAKKKLDSFLPFILFFFQVGLSSHLHFHKL